MNLGQNNQDTCKMKVASQLTVSQTLQFATTSKSNGFQGTQERLRAYKTGSSSYVQAQVQLVFDGDSNRGNVF